MAPATVFLAVLLASTAVHHADAGCKKRRATNVSPEELAAAARPLPLEQLLTAAEMPRNFSWLDVNGVNMLVPSWNQHIVS